MTDVDEFSPIDGVLVPDLPLHLVLDPTRGDELRNTSPIEALAAFRSVVHSPLTRASRGSDRAGSAGDVAARVG